MMKPKQTKILLGKKILYGEGSMKEKIKWAVNHMPASEDRQLEVMSLRNVAKASFCLRQHFIRLPGRACQPESDLPEQTAYSFLPSVSEDLGIVFFGSQAGPLLLRIHALPLP